MALSRVAAVSGAHAVEGAQLWCGGSGDGVDVVFEAGGFGI
jgi:hypothetical protein